MIKVSILGQQEVIDDLNKKKSSVVAAIFQTMKVQAVNLVRYIQMQKLQSGTPLHHRSGRLQSSIKQNVTQSNTLVSAKIYTNVSYAAIHEYGGTIPAKEIFPKNAQALSFIWHGKQVFFKKVNRPAIKMPERSFMRSALKENEGVILNALRDTVNRVLKS